MSDIGFTEISARNAESLSVSEPLEPWSGVRYVWDGDEYDGESVTVKKGDQIGSAGDETGRVLIVKTAFGRISGNPAHTWDNPARHLLASIQGDVYSPFEAVNAVLDPAFEIGDAVSFPDGLSMICAMSGELDGLCSVDVSAPPDEAVNTAYPANWL